MSLKIEDILFTGPFPTESYIFKKNKPRTIILLVKREGKNYDPIFIAIDVILTKEVDINLKQYLMNKFDGEKIEFDKISVFFREYNNKKINKIEEDFEKIKKLLNSTNELIMKY